MSATKLNIFAALILVCMTSPVLATKTFDTRNCEGGFGFIVEPSQRPNVINPAKLDHSQSFLRPFANFYETLSHREYPVLIREDFSHYLAAVETTLARGDIKTIFLRFENRVGIPPELVAGPGEDAARKMSAIGSAKVESIARASLEFYLEQIKRRTWSEKMKSDLQNEFWETLPHSTLAVSYLRSSEEVIGTLQTIRAPYGLRTICRGPMGENMQEAVYGDWGPSYRKLGFLHPKELAATDWELLDLDSKRAQGKPSTWFRFQPPVEKKMIKNGLTLHREIFTEPWSQELDLGEGQKVYANWGAGEVDEHARVAIKPELNKKLFADAYLQLFAQAIDQDFSDQYNLLYRTYWTYNDYPQLYHWAGYRPTGDHFNIDGIKFDVLKVSGLDHIRALLEFRRSVDPSDEDITKQLQMIYEKFGGQKFYLRGKVL